MCNAFVYNGAKVNLVLPKPKSTIPNVNQYIEMKFGIVVNFEISFYKKFSKNRIIEKYFGFASIEKILNTTDADFIFTRLPKYVSLVLKKKKNLIFESHNSILHNKYKLIDWYWKKVFKKNIRNDRFKLFISISENLSKYWSEKGILKEKQISLHDGFNKKLFDTIPSKKASRQELSIPLDKKIAMYTGSLYPDREIENILYAAKNTPDIEYYVIGGPEEFKNKYVALAKDMKLKNLKFLGYVTHNMIPKYLATADYLLALWSNKVPTINYCSPLKIFEYMASGNLIIAHDFPTIREVLTEGETAYFVDPNDKENLSEVIQKVKNIDTNVIAQNSKDLVYEKYTWQKRAELIINELR